jgi:hypothetical protein
MTTQMGVNMMTINWKMIFAIMYLIFSIVYGIWVIKVTCPILRKNKKNATSN